MGDQGNSGDNQQSRNEDSNEPVPPVNDSYQKAKLRAHKAYETAKRLAGRLREVSSSLTKSEILMVFFTAVIAGATIWNVVVVSGQLSEMHSSGIDTHNLADATSHLSDHAMEQAAAMEKLRVAGEAQAAAMDKLRAAGEAQAKAAEGLAEAGRAQADATRNLADNSARQLGAIQASAEAAKSQAAAVQEQASATVTASKSTDRLAQAGQPQAAAVVQSLEVARAANDIATRASVAADRPWVSISMPIGDTEPVADQEYKIEFNVLNVGRSPALSATTNVAFTIIKVTDTFESVLGACPTCQKVTLFPSGGSFQATTPAFHPTLDAKIMTADEVKRIANREDTILLRNRVDYLDTSNKPHMTSGCMYFIPKFGFTNCPVGSQAN